MAYPIAANRDAVRSDQIEAYFGSIFKHVDWSEGGILSILGIGEKGTPQEGVFRERKFLSPLAGDISLTAGHARRWAEHEIATFIVPAVIHPGAQLAGDVKLEQVKAFTAIMVDLDTGDTTAKLERLEAALFPATMVVLSGGTTDAGHPKRHVYWRLTEPSTEIDRIAAARKLLAAKAGGDQSFGRATQVIRLPGSLHCKDGGARPVTIERMSEAECELEDLLAAIADMDPFEGVSLALPALPALTFGAGGGMDFSGAAGKSISTVATALTQEVREGGDETNRWGEFSKVGGHHIHLARQGLQTLEEAFDKTQGWVMANMVPAWPEARMRTEFSGLLKADIANHGVIVPVPEPTAVMVDGESINSTADLLSWAVHLRSSNSPPTRKILVDGLIFAGKRHMLVAEGGAGKTFLCMDLALKLAAVGPDKPLKWIGQTIRPEAHGGTVIIMTGEDDLDELDIRWNAIDPDGRLRGAAGARLIALPLDNLGGAFPLVSQHPATREAIASAKWVALYQAMRGVVDAGGRVSAVIIDTLNSTLHGEENSAMVIGEYIRAVAPICGELKAALIVTHHVRKAGAEPIRTIEDMRDAIRGSTALPNAMRLVIGVWAAHDYERRMKAMHLKPARATLFRAGVVKANMPEALREPKTLMRDKAGLLEDVSAQDTLSRGANREARTWLAWAVREAADVKAPFARSGQNGVFARRHQLPTLFHHMSRDGDVTTLIDAMLNEGELISKPLADGGKGHIYLDVPECIAIPRYMDVNHGLDLKWRNFYYDHGWDEIRNGSGD